MFYIVILATLIATIIFYFKWRYQFWHRRNLPYLEPTIPWGTYMNPLNGKRKGLYKIRENYNAIKKKGWKHAGLYFMTLPAYMIVDLEMLKNVMTKDFQYFSDRAIYVNEKSDPLSSNLFSVGGARWRQMRTKLTPAFTSGKIKMMFQTLLGCTPNLVQAIEDQTEEIDIKDVLECFTTDVIGTCVFGIECNSFEDKNSPFRVNGRKIFQPTLIQTLKLVLILNCFDFAQWLGICVTPKEVTKFFTKTVKDVVEYRQKNNITGNDFLQLLLDLNESGTSFSHNEITAQCVAFFVAGFENSSTLMACALYEVAKNILVQEKLREEINSVLEKHGKVTYEAIQEMKYLDQVLNETLRKYPPATYLSRQCVEDYKVPGTDVTIEKGTPVMLPLIAIHYDEELYPDPEKFDPDRFCEENVKSRHPYAHIPFGEGPRGCIGMRFGLMQAKVGLCTLLKSYEFTVNNKTSEPLKFLANLNTLAIDGGIWLNAEKVD